MLLALALHAGVVEEVTFRGYMQNTTNSKYTRIVSYLIIATLFSVFHFLPWQLFLPYMLSSIGFSFAADKFKSIAVPLVAHVLVDFIIFMLYYFGLGEIQALDENKLLGAGIGLALTVLAFAMLLVKKNSTKLDVAQEQVVSIK